MYGTGKDQLIYWTFKQKLDAHGCTNADPDMRQVMSEAIAWEDFLLNLG